MKYAILLISTILLRTTFVLAQETITFPSLDKIRITADVYRVPKEKMKGVILLCHQANYSRGEYIYTAKILVNEGYCCIAIDQRSGGRVNQINNQTNAEALIKKKSVNYLDAEKDIIAGLNYAYSQFHQPIILFGSSYSSSLVIKIASEHKNKAKACISYSPGEYFQNDTLLVSKALKNLKVPLFVSCGKNEIEDTKKLLNAGDKNIIYFSCPPKMGVHGSKTLWKEIVVSNGNKILNLDFEYNWKELIAFLLKIQN